jgi:exodeoxyribonuclease-3
VRVVTWNVNGIRARGAQVLAFLEEHRPSALLLQEIKATPEQVPADLHALAERYWLRWHGAPGGYSGVALLLDKTEFPEEPAFEIPPIDFETRVALARTPDVTLAVMYLPNGGKDYAAKIRFLEALGPWAHDESMRGPFLLAGDLNVTRTAMDVHPSQQDESAIAQRPDERSLFEAALASGGFTDLTRVKHPDDDRFFTWWPFWKGAKQRNLGQRIDYVLTNGPLTARLESVTLHRAYGTSDHAPLEASFARPAR